jgi:hypothetical protein
MTDRCYDCKIASDEHASDILLSCVTCEKKFHGQCVSEKLDQHFVEMIAACPNLTWRCDYCVIMFTESKSTIDRRLDLIFGKLEAMSSDIDALKSKPAPLKTLASILVDSESARSGKRPFAQDSPSGSPMKRKRYETKPSTPALIMGAGAANDEIKTVEPKKWLYVSNLDPQTTEEAVVKLISSGLQSAPTEFSCVKLLPKNVLAPTFISFKIGMRDELFQKSLAPELWPSGIAFREFVDRPRSFPRRTVTRIPE